MYPKWAASGLETAAIGGAKRPAGGRYGTCPMRSHRAACRAYPAGRFAP